MSQEYIIRSSDLFWRPVRKISYKPYINQFWTYNFLYKRFHASTNNSSKKNLLKKKEKIILCQYCEKLKELVISKIEVDLSKFKKRIDNA
jgi:hypothetical protein